MFYTFNPRFTVEHNLVFKLSDNLYLPKARKLVLIDVLQINPLYYY